MTKEIPQGGTILIYQDVYMEQHIHRQTPKVIRIYNILLIAITVFVAFSFVFIDYRIFGLPLIIMIIAAYFVTQNTKVDFDYTYTNGFLEITKIKRKSKRQDLICCEIKDIVVVAPSKTGPVQPYVGRHMKTFDCLSHDPEVSYYTMIIRDPNTRTETKVLFEPDEALLEAMHRIAPDKVHIGE